jgi:DNA repair protein RadA/Sms
MDVFNLDQRLNEAKAQHFKRAIVPSMPQTKLEDIKCFKIDEVSKLIEWM